MSHLTTCYGADIEALADLAGDLGPVSTDMLAAFNLQQWSAVAEALGFAQPLKSAVRGLLTMRTGILPLTPIALATFDTWHRARPRQLSSAIPIATRSARAHVRRNILSAYAEANPAALWFLDARPDTLAGGACFDRSGTSLTGRAFLEDAPANFFHDNRGAAIPTTCGWEGPVLLSLGTYPWVYGGRLHRAPPGLDWDTVGAISPAGTAMALCSGLWQPKGNLQQDARPIVHRYRHFQKACDFALRELPAYDTRTAIPGRLYRRGLLLHTEHASLELHTVESALGPLNAAAHNYIVQRFAAFFGLRRALLRDIARLPADLAPAIVRNPDPCLRPFAAKAVRL